MPSKTATPHNPDKPNSPQKKPEPRGQRPQNLSSSPASFEATDQKKREIPFWRSRSNPNFQDSNDTSSADIGWYTFDGLEQSCNDTTDLSYVNTTLGGVTLGAHKWHNDTFPSGFIDGHAKTMHSMTLPTTGCWGATYQFYVANFGTGLPSGPLVSGGTPWGNFFIQPNVLNYYGEWWDATH